MKAAFPYMGTAPIALDALIRGLGADVVLPPKPTRDVLELGSRLAPEMMCVPFKLTLGNMVRSLEAGADTLVYVSGSWSCRFGYYGRLQAEILRDLGYRFRLLELRHDNAGMTAKEIVRLSRRGHVGAVLRAARALRLGWLKSTAVEEVERCYRARLPLAVDPGECRQSLDGLLERIRRTDSPRGLLHLRGLAAGAFQRVAANGRRHVPRVRLVGESFCVVEPFINFDIVQRLGEMGVLADPFLTAHRWLGFHGFRMGRSEVTEMRRLSAPYWRYCVGGEDQNSVGHLLMAAERGYAGVIHVHPFGCMPGSVVQPTMVRAARDTGIAYLSLSLDEHASETGVLTRLEAFASLLEKRGRLTARTDHL
jgi:predicted nucleotide-binding protein (sugar kinase/HSP70/actin superfamily)